MQSLNHFITKPALLIVDMQKDFVIKQRKTIIPYVMQLRKSAQELHIPTLFVQEKHRASGIDFGMEIYFSPPHALEGTEGTEFIPELELSPSDFAVTSKRRYSAFFQTDLDLLLRSLAIKTLIMVGVSTEVCILATAFDAHAHDYSVVVVKECVSGLTPQGHKGALHIIELALGKVVTIDELMEVLK